MKTMTILNINSLKMKVGGIFYNRLFIILILTSSTFFSQNSISFSINADYRITPIYANDDGFYEGPRTPTTNSDTQLSGPSFGYVIKYHFNKNKMNFSFRHTMKKDLLVFENHFENDGDLNKAVNAFIQDYHFELERKFFNQKKFNLGVKVGVSLMNRGTEYTYYKVLNEDPLVLESSDQNFGFSAISLNLGLIKDNFSIYFGVYSVGSHQYEDLDPDSSFLIPNIQLQYKVFDLLKSSK